MKDTLEWKSNKQFTAVWKHKFMEVCAWGLRGSRGRGWRLLLATEGGRDWGLAGQKRLPSIEDDLTVSKIMQVSIRQMHGKNASGGTKHGKGLEVRASWHRLPAQTVHLCAPCEKVQAGGAGRWF